MEGFFMKLEPESRKQLLRIAGGTAICTAAMWVRWTSLWRTTPPLPRRRRMEPVTKGVKPNKWN